jgi:hypothetical protein
MRLKPHRNNLMISRIFLQAASAIALLVAMLGNPSGAAAADSEK